MFQSERIGKPGEIKGGENVLLLAYLVSAPFLLLVSIRFRCLTYDKEKKKKKEKEDRNEVWVLKIWREGE